MIWTQSKFFHFESLSRIDFRQLPVIFLLMLISILVLSSNSSAKVLESSEEVFFTPLVKTQMQWFFLGISTYLFFSVFQYNKLREWTWFFYILVILALIGVLFSDPINGVRRWYRIPFLRMGVQPSEQAKIVVIMALSWFLEQRGNRTRNLSTAFLGALIVGIPFLLILKQPDLGSALILIPVMITLFYFAGVHPFVIRLFSWISLLALAFVASLFLGFISQETIRPYTTYVLKEYQFDRLDPNTHHQKAAATAIAIGGLTGSGFKKSEFTRRGFLPYPCTDSVFPAFGEEFGFFGLLFLLSLFYALIYFSFQAAASAKDLFGRFLGAGFAVYFAMHVLINVGMLTGFLPITGVPLPLISSGGSSIITTMMALGILQNIYSQRFMF